MRAVGNVISECPTESVRRQWRASEVGTLTADDVAAIVAVLRRHAAASQIERLERAHALAGGRSWAPVTITLEGAQGRDGRYVVPPPDGWVSAFGARTFGHSATFEARRPGIVVTVDDNPELARQTLREIRAIVGRRHRRRGALLASAWGVPSFVLSVPILASVVETASGWAGLALAATAVVAVGLGLWLYWLNRIWLARPVAMLPPGLEVPAATTPATATRAVLSGVAVLLVALIGMS